MAEVLLIGPDRERAKGIQSLLHQDSHRVHWVRGVERWREAERQFLPEVVVAAVAETAAVLEASGRPPGGFPAPILFVQHETDFFRETYLEERLVDRIASPFTAEEILARVDALVRVRRVVRRQAPGADGASVSEDETGRPGWMKGVARRIAAILHTRLPRFQRPTVPYLEVASRVADWTDRRDVFEPGHAERVTSFCAMMSETLGLPDDEAGTLLRAAMLHDIGKVVLPVEILRQQGPLEEAQMRLVRTHAERGAALIKMLDPDQDVAEAILYHHERADGAGYHGIPARETPRAARILAVAEAYDAMTTSRVRRIGSQEKALSRLREGRGGAWDPVAVDALCEALRPRPALIPLSPLS